MSLPPRPPPPDDSEYRSLLLRNIRDGHEGAETAYRGFLIKEGEYFYSLEEVIPTEQIENIPLQEIVGKDDDGSKRKDYAGKFKRTKTPDYMAEGGRDGVQEFVTTKKAMVSNALVASVNSKGHSSNTKKKIWDVDIFARPFSEAKKSQVAHLLPDAADHAVEWYDVACWAIGEDPEKTDWATIFRLLHGTKGSDKKRAFGTGLRHFVANKARINGQDQLLDKEDPQLLIIPILSVEDCVDWNGQGYQAIVLVGADSEGKSRAWATAEVGLTDIKNIAVFDADGEDLETALLSLKECVFALTQALVNYESPRVPDNATEEEKRPMKEAVELRRGRLESFRAAVDSLGTGGSIPVPKEGNTGPRQQHRAICKIFFSNDASEENYLHPAPDPILLLARAAVVWSVRQKIRLRASAIAQAY